MLRMILSRTGVAWPVACSSQMGKFSASMALEWVRIQLFFYFIISVLSLGTGGYGKRAWALGQSYADDPVLTPVLYDPAAPAGQRWSSDGFSASTVPRMYHSSALLLADGLLILLSYIFGFTLTYYTVRLYICLWFQSQQRLRWT